MKRLLILLSILILFKPFAAAAGTEHLVYFENTDYELHVYKIYGIEKGKTLMIMGGVQGDEPGGYLAADLYADMALRKGSLIVVPRANFLSIIKNSRAINGDMNRRFSKNSSEYYEDRVVEILKGLIAESDFLLNLHEGSGFYSEQWESPSVNPDRFGQSIIADADLFLTKDGRELHLGATARRTADKVNTMIADERHYFKFNNHRTSERETRHSEQRGSATFFALSTRNIPAFGVETSKEIKNLEAKVRYQTMVINTFMEEFGIIPENPKVAIAVPLLSYMIVFVNGTYTVVYNDEELKVRKGDRIKVVDVAGNYSRGISVDFVGVGTANDLRKEFVVSGPLTAIVKKDGLNYGRVRIVPEDGGAPPSVAASVPRFNCFILEVNGMKHVLKDGEHINIVRGDVIKLSDAFIDGALSSEVKVNFLGFVGDRLNNAGDDRGYAINSAKDLWPKYSYQMKGKNYTIVINRKNSRIGMVYVDIEEPKMDYMVLRQNRRDKRWCSDGEVITVSQRDTIEVVDVKTNIAGNAGVSVYFDGRANMEKLLYFEDAVTNEVVAGDNSGEYRLLVRKEGLLLGGATVRVGEPLINLGLR